MNGYSDLDYAMDNDQAAIYEFTNLVAEQEKTIRSLREQIKVLRDALEGLLSMVPDNQAIYNHMILQKQIARAALEQTKPKDGE